MSSEQTERLERLSRTRCELNSPDQNLNEGLILSRRIDALESCETDGGNDIVLEMDVADLRRRLSKLESASAGNAKPAPACFKCGRPITDGDCTIYLTDPPKYGHYVCEDVVTITGPSDPPAPPSADLLTAEERQSLKRVLGVFGAGLTPKDNDLPLRVGTYDIATVAMALDRLAPPPKRETPLVNLGLKTIMEGTGTITSLHIQPPKDDGIEERARVWINSHDEPHDYFSYPTTCADFARSELARLSKQHAIELVKARIEETLNPNCLAELRAKLASIESQQEAKPQKGAQ